MIGLFWEAHQQAGISTAKMDAQSARRKADEALLRLDAAERKADKALLICEALWTLMRDRYGMTDEHLVAQVQEIDMTDGFLDGRVRRPPVDCPACNRRTTQRYLKCMYCGTEVGGTAFGA